jgi:MOSC domain-containing protein
MRGTVAAIYRYPVKAMAGEPLREAELGWHGVPGDRRYAFVQSEHTGDFPWLTIRELPAMPLSRPAAAADPEQPPTVRTPTGDDLPIGDPRLAGELSAASRRRIHLHRDHRGTFDSSPVSVISVQAVAALSELVGRPLDPVRFRPNLVIDAPGYEFPEEACLGRSLTVGAATVRLDRRDERCMVINFDHRTAERNPAVLRAVAQHREVCIGVYGTVETPGLVRVGDPVQAA